MPIPKTPTRFAVVIGDKFNGPAGFADTRTGTYWEVMPIMEGDHLLLQDALLEHARKAKMKRAWRNFQRWPAPAVMPGLTALEDINRRREKAGVPPLEP